MISPYKEIEWLINIYKDLADSSRDLSRRTGFIANPLFLVSSFFYII